VPSIRFDTMPSAPSRQAWHVAALGMPVGLASLSYDNGEQEEKTTIEDLARLYGGFSLLKLRAMKTSYPLLALLLLSCCNEIKPIRPDV
jgi:hypothetical protein